MGTTIQLKTADGVAIGAYRADPAGACKGAIVVVQEIFGVNHHIRAVTDRFAAEGYVALAPALFDRVEKGVELDYDEAGVARGSALARKISIDQNFLSIEAAIESLADVGAIGVVGFCLGGTLAYVAAARSEFLAAAVGYYGGGIAGLEKSPLQCPVELHFGEKDAHIPQADVEKIKAQNPDIPVYTYPAGHGFNCDERGSYDAPSATLAWQRTRAFLARHLPSQD